MLEFCKRVTQPAIKISVLAATALLAVPVCVLAQDSDEAAGTTSVLMEEITVTARRRPETLADLPMSVSAYGADSLEIRGIRRIDEIDRISPNIKFQNNPSFGGSSNSAAVRIRGIGSAEFTPTTDPSVGIFVDGVYLARTIGSILDILDFDQVEVLRGPQGTLFGRNTIGGVVNVTTKRPSEDFNAKISGTYGTDNWLDIRGSVNFPISDTFFAKISAGTFNQDGYVERSDGLDLGDRSSVVAKLDLRWEPSDAFVADFAFDVSSTEENGPAMSLIDIRFGPQTIDPSTPPFVFFNNVAATLGGAVPNPLPPGPPPPECATDAAPVNIANPFCYDDRYISGVNESNQGDSASFSDVDVFGAALTLEWDINDWLALKSITSYREIDSQFARDGDHSPLVISAYADDLEQEQVSQEIQLLGDVMDGRFDWILGFYYFQEDGQNVNTLDFLISSFQSGGFFDNQSIAVFGQGTFDITDRWHLTAGVRWTEDERKFLPDQVIFTFNPDTAGFFSPMQQFIFQPGTPILPSVEAERSVDEVTPLINLSFDVTDSVMVYGMYSEGFKSGGFTQRVFPPLIPGATCPSLVPVECIPGFEPEFVDVYEAGLRFNAPDNRLRILASAFYTDYEDLQISTFTSVAPVIKNAAAATITGFEVELQASPYDKFFIEASVGYTDPEYDEIDPSTQVDLNNDFERVSEWTGHIGASKDFFIGDWVATPRIDWSYQSNYFNDAFNSPQIGEDDFSLIDLSAAFLNNKGFLVVAGVRNLTDKEYLATGVFGDAFSSFEGVYDRGRQWFVQLTYEH